MKKNKKILLWLILFFSLVIIADIAGVVRYYYFIENFFTNKIDEQTSDAALVFFGDFDFDEMQFGNDSKQRLEHTIQLYRTKKVKNIICVGGYRKSENFIGSAHMRKYLINSGINPTHIFNDSTSFDTNSNLIEAEKIIVSKQFNEITLISSPLHVYRISQLTNMKGIHFNPYKYNNQTIGDYYNLFISIHHEWIAYLLPAILSKENYAKLIAWQRR